MRALSKASAAVLETLTEGLDSDTTHRKIDNTGSTYMPVSVDRLGADRFSVAHNFEQNGDLVSDPDMEFVCVDGAWYPATCQMATGTYSVALEMNPDGTISGVRRRTYADLRSFATMWMRNIREQQGLKIKRVRRERAVPA